MQDKTLSKSEKQAKLQKLQEKIKTEKQEFLTKSEWKRILFAIKHPFKALQLRIKIKKEY